MPVSHTQLSMEGSHPLLICYCAVGIMSLVCQKKATLDVEDTDCILSIKLVWLSPFRCISHSDLARLRSAQAGGHGLA